jgi:hypothetical protein
MSNSSLPVDNIAVLAIENDSTRWIGTVNGGFVKMVDTSFTVYNLYLNNFPDNTITGIVIDSSGIKWEACPAGSLVRFFNGAVFAYNTGSSNIPTNTLTNLVFDSLQNLYIGSFDKGLIKKTGNSFVYWDTQNSAMPDDLIYAVAVERTGIIWCGTETHGVVRFDEFGVTAVPANNTLTGRGMYAYPNPASSYCTLRFSDKRPRRIRIVDELGRELNNFQADQLETNVDLSDYDAGVYFISATDQEKTFTSRVVLSH